MTQRDKEIGARLKKLRETYTHLTQSQFAKKLNIGVRAYQSYEQGVRTLQSDHARAIAEFTNTNPDYLLKPEQCLYPTEYMRASSELDQIAIVRKCLDELLESIGIQITKEFYSKELEQPDVVEICMPDGTTIEATRRHAQEHIYTMYVNGQPHVLSLTQRRLLEEATSEFIKSQIVCFSNYFRQENEEIIKTYKKEC